MAAITSITLIEGGPAVHVTANDQAGNPLPPASIAWESSSVVTITPDATGFNFAANPRGSSTSFNITATYTAQQPNATGVLTVNVVLPGVTMVTFTSP